MNAALQRKLAGVPVWAWLIGATVAIGFGLYLRHRAAAAANTSTSSGPTGAGDLANALAGGATADPASGLDPATAELLANAQAALLQQSQLLADSAYASTYGSGYGYDDGFNTPATTNVASSPAGTVSYPVGLAARSYFAAKQFSAQPTGLVFPVGVSSHPAAVSSSPTTAVVGTTSPAVSHPLGVVGVRSIVSAPRLAV